MTNKLIQKLKPGISKRHILLIAAFVWTMAGIMLFVRGAAYIIQLTNYRALHFIVAIIFGLGFFWVLFKKISRKHIYRIRNIEIENPCVFSFFNFRSYLIMGFMITMGIMLRRSSYVNKEILYTFYIGMGMPLLISAGSFFMAWFKDQVFYRSQANYKK